MSAENNNQTKRQRFINHFENCLTKLEKELIWASVDESPSETIVDIRTRIDDTIRDIFELKNGTRDIMWGLSTTNANEKYT